MALIQVNFISKSLAKNVTINVILPTDRVLYENGHSNEQKPYKTLFLLHGLTGNYTDWVSGTNIQRLAEENNFAVVMPSGENSFYIDNPGVNKNFGEFIGKELVEITRKMFPLSTKRQDTFIAGLSMGGFGAIRNGLKYHETFGYIAGFSSAFITDNIEKRTNDNVFFSDTRAFVEDCFGDLDNVAKSDKNPRWLIKHLLEQNIDIPKIYLACGEDDFLIKENRDFKNYLCDIGMEVTYEEAPGEHDWDFWQHCIKRVVDWLPITKTN